MGRLVLHSCGAAGRRRKDLGELSRVAWRYFCGFRVHSRFLFVACRAVGPAEADPFAVRLSARLSFVFFFVLFAPFCGY
jgi:hypothetical protein